MYNADLISSLDISSIKQGTKVADIRTGEELVYERYDGIYCLCCDSRGVTLWLLPERLVLR